MSGIQMKLEDRKRTFDPKSLGFERVETGRRSKYSRVTDDCDAYMLVHRHNRKEGGTRNTCRICVSIPFADKIADSLGERFAISTNDSTSFVISYGDFTSFDKSHSKNWKRITADTLFEHFSDKLGGYGRINYDVEVYGDGVAFIFNTKSTVLEEQD